MAGFSTKKTVSSGAVTIPTAIDNFITACRGKGLSAGTITGYSSRLGRIFAEWCSFAKLEYLQDLDIQHIDAYLTYLADKGYKDSTRRSVSVQLKTFFSWCKSRNYKVNIDLRKMQHPRKTPDAKIKLVPDKDIKTLMDYFDKSELSTHLRLQMLMYLWLETGLRITESCSIAVSDIDTKAGTIGVLGKGKKFRTVYITKTLTDKLSVWMQERDNQLNGAGFTSVWLFPSYQTQGKTCIQSQHPMAQLREICVELGLPKHTPHAFRHTFAVNWLLGGGDIRSLQKVMGHSSLEVTQTYLRYTPNHVQDAAMKIVSTMERIGEQ